MRNLIAIKASDMADISTNAIFKNKVRDALLIFDAARSLGFSSFLTDDHEEVIKTAFDHIMEIARDAGGLLLPLENPEEPKKPARKENKSNLFIAESVDAVKNKFHFLEAFQSLFVHDDGWYILKMKESVNGALEFLRESALKFVTYLKTTAENCKSRGNLNPVMLNELQMKSHLCECYSAIDNYLPAESSYKFIIVGQSFKSLIMDISTSTRNKILVHDYSGILDDLKKFHQGVPSIVKEVKQILQLVFKELHNDALKTEQSARSFRLGTTNALTNQTLINDLYTISERSLNFMTYVIYTQKPVIGIRLEIVTIMNQSRSLIFDQCKSSLDNLQFSSVRLDFLEAEGTIKSVESMLLLLEKLADDNTNDRKAQEPHITQVKMNPSASSFSSPLFLPFVRKLNISGISFLVPGRALIYNYF